MINLTSTPSVAAAARLEACAHQAQEALRLVGVVPNSTATCYRHPDVKASIVAETAGKCAYCEGKMTHVYWGDVEHLRPQAHFPELSLVYDNLTLACAICNNKKGNYFNEDAPILNPYEDNPEEHLVGLGAIVWHRHASRIGQRTIDLLDLNRDGLNERRHECIQRLSALADRYVDEPEGPIKRTLAAQLRDETSNSAEFAMVARSFLAAAYNLQ